MPGKQRALLTNVSLCWWLYVWAVAVLLTVAEFRHDARFFGVDFIGFFAFSGIVCLIYLFVAEIVPPFWWLLTLPWHVRSRPLAAVGIVAAVALWLAGSLTRGDTALLRAFGTTGMRQCVAHCGRCALSLCPLWPQAGPSGRKRAELRARFSGTGYR
jgi:uncharacterized membrane protein YvlD (DUF360 family)